MTLRLDAQPSALGQVREAMARFWAEQHLPTRRRADVQLAVGEAVANVISHAYRGRTDAVLELEAHVEERDLHVVVVDHGHGFGPNPSSEGAGLGLGMILHLADRLEIGNGREAGENTLELVFDLDA